jgi:hypothetical protein
MKRIIKLKKIKNKKRIRKIKCKIDHVWMWREREDE